VLQFNLTGEISIGATDLICSVSSTLRTTHMFISGASKLNI